MLTNPFYIGNIKWSGQTYKGTHPCFISPELYVQAQSVLHGHNKTKYSKHEIAFRELLTCAHDNCTVTAELKKNKYVYYRCTGHRGKCALPHFREQEISERLSHVLQYVQLPEEVVKGIGASLQKEHVQMRNQITQERTRLERELTTLRSRMDAAYADKLDGKITEEFWQRLQADWQAEEQRIKSRIAGLEEDKSNERLLTVQRILEFAQQVHYLYLTRMPAEKAELFKTVLLTAQLML